MSETLNVVLTWPASAEKVRLYESYVSSKCRIVVPQGTEPDDLTEVARDADVIVGGYVPAFMIAAAKNLRMVQVTHAGAIAGNPLEPDLDQAYLGFSLKMLQARGLLMGNIHGNSVLVAEQAVTFLLVLAKRMVQADRALSDGKWYPSTESTRSVTIKGSTVAIVGLGSIGQEVARRVRAFGASVTAIKRNPAPELVRELGLDFLGGPEDLHRVLSEADFVVLTTPLTHETYKMIGEAELRTMKKTAFLINVARGDLVQEKAVFQALTGGGIAGFASDVWWFYDCRPFTEEFLTIGYFCPVPSRLGVHRLENVIATADRSCFTTTMEEDYMKDALQNVDMLAAGKTPANLVDFDEQY